jgi:cytochrome b561
MSRETPMSDAPLATPAPTAPAEAGSTGGYAEPIRVLHWVVAGLLALQFLIAWTMPAVHRGTRPDGLIAWHVGLGTLILLLMVVRLLLRWSTPKPPPPADLSLPVQLLSRANHVLLYVLLLALPMMGWINASSRGWPVSLAGIIPLQKISPTGSTAGIMMGDLHMTLAWVLLAVIAVHLAGAFNHILLRDGVIDRIVPARFRRRPA